MNFGALHVVHLVATVLSILVEQPQNVQIYDFGLILQAIAVVSSSPYCHCMCVGPRI